ncbi:MAG: POT family MFS transporter [Verrucomicrobiota bacterium]|nr:POT family MFS transporter [Verrucomicrobiota bacterium]MEC8659751.1 POT family MFS transporter [Verrucomicrobiota bacterium]MEC8691004.1 POT family MFS transporter [Verrucomicrobiota bacterium]
MSKYRTSPLPTNKYPPGIPYIIANEAAERFSFYGMKAALAIFLANYLGILGGDNYSETKATVVVSWFNTAVYLTPLLGALIADTFFGKYRTIMTLSIVYCLGHLCLALMGIGGFVQLWLLSGLGLISLGAGGIKPCVSAHVGDQFGTGNQHLITKIFNIFYFSINFGAVISNLLIPWVLKWYGPHLAFGIPGILMALATIFFWMGRTKFAHIPAKGAPFLSELFSKEGLSVIGKLIPLVIFVGVFWSLFDQTASRLVFQAERMDREIFGLEILPSQIQAANPFLILVLIPLFTFVLYPLVGKIVNLTPLKKIGSGLALMALAFAVVSLAQEAIDRGETPHVGWQLLAYLILTSAEVMVSIVALEFFYTQAPKKMKSLMMAIFLSSVSIGNFFTAFVNQKIQIEVPSEDEISEVISMEDQDKIKKLLTDEADKIEAYYNKNQKLPTAWKNEPLDPWGTPIIFQLTSATEATIRSQGHDKTLNTKWDYKIEINVKKDEKDLDGTWLYEEKKRRGIIETSTSEDKSVLSYSISTGGGDTLKGADYYWFFTKLMLATALIFIPFALLYRPKTYLHQGPFTIWTQSSNL